MTDYRFWKKRNWLLYGGVVVLLALCFVPGIGRDINGESRWIEFGSLRLQPSEFAKIAGITFLAYWFSRHPDGGDHLVQGFGAPLAVVSLPLLLILFEVDIGTTAVRSTTTFLIHVSYTPLTLPTTP